MDAQKQWPLPQNAFHCIYTPELLNNSDNAFHQVLGYPICPLIGRYNKGQYKIGEVLFIAEFKCKFIDGNYFCGDRKLTLPKTLVQKLRTIPEVIPHNKPKNQQKNQKIPDVHPLYFPVRDELSFQWIISLGQIGKDFFNYLNQTYIFDASVFFGPKLKLTTHNLPIMAYFPEKSGLEPEEVERGICMTHYRSEYLSVHLKAGSPAFSPNNMRLGIEGMKKPKEPKNNEKKKGKKHKNPKENQKEKEIPQIKQNMPKEEYDEFNLDWEELEKEIPNENSQEPKKIQKIVEEKQQQKPQGHQQFVHFYTSVLQQEQYKVFYHWYIGQANRKEIIQQLLKGVPSIEELIAGYMSVIGLDPMIGEISHILNM